ncbi:hypothetical protein [Mycetohabitans rhizoxinica]
MITVDLHERFFTEMVAELDEPILPFGLTDVHRDDAHVTDAQ